MPAPNWKLDDDFKTVTVMFPAEPPVSVKLDVGGVEEILSKLAEFRAHMKPGMAPDFARGQQVLAEQNLQWVAEADANGDTLLHIRDSGFGWLHFVVPKEEARRLAAALQAQVDAVPTAQRTAKPKKPLARHVH